MARLVAIDTDGSPALPLRGGRSGTVWTMGLGINAPAWACPQGRPIPFVALAGSPGAWHLLRRRLAEPSP